MKDLTGHPDGYRQIPVALQDGDGVVSYQPPSFNEVPSLMKAFFSWLYTSVTGFESPYSSEQKSERKIHPLLISGITHHFIGYIHPFPDGNGRTARAFSTLVGLIHNDLSKIKDAFSVEEFIDKRIEDYYDTLMLATQGTLKPFLMFYLECVNDSLTKVLNELQRYDKTTWRYLQMKIKSLILSCNGFFKWLLLKGFRQQSFNNNRVTQAPIMNDMILPLQ